jgi:succinoglycan biosynthesis protein ExoM
MQENGGSVLMCDRISVCVCTYKRPDLLARLLDALANQIVDAAFAFDVVVVDNDSDRSSEEVVRSNALSKDIEVSYYGEPERNISLARNRAVRNAAGNLIAFIDDDERPVSDWLVHLYRTMKRHGADAVLGPVIPDFPAAAPSWLKKGRLFDRKRHPTGSSISAGDARTGNVLMDRSLFAEGQLWFDPAFGRTGGEDSDFFARQFREGRVFVWCDEAIAYEAVPSERCKALFHVRRLWRAGTLHGEWIRDGRRPGGAVLVKNVAVLGACALLVAPSLMLPKHLWIRIAQKLAYCAGMVTAYLGLSLLRHRE